MKSRLRTRDKQAITSVKMRRSFVLNLEGCWRKVAERDRRMRAVRNCDSRRARRGMRRGMVMVVAVGIVVCGDFVDVRGWVCGAGKCEEKEKRREEDVRM